MFRYLQDFLSAILEIVLFILPSSNKMNQKKLKHFNILNQLQMKETSVVCGKCGNWLTGEVYLHHADEKSYCKSCSSKESEATDRRRIQAQEDFLKDSLFPCKSLECDFILRAYQVDEHLRKCIYQSFTCTLCGRLVKNDKAYIKHLRTVHRDITVGKTMALDEPTFNISVTGPISNEMMIISLCQRIFVAHIQRNKTSISVEIAKIKDFPHRDECSRFHIQYEVEDKKWTCEKNYVLFSDFRTESNKDLDINTDNSKTINVKICLLESAYFLKLAECPICLNNLTFKVYQCSNGHNVCIPCGEMILTCAMCRSRSKSIVQLDYLFPSMSMLCPSLNNGCFAVIKGDDVHAHALYCTFRTVQCPECDGEFSKSSLISHFQKKHEVRENYFMNYYEVVDIIADTKYLKFKNQIFCFKYQVVQSGKHDDKMMCFRVQLLDAASVSEAHKYKFEVHMGFEAWGDTQATTILRGVCQTTSNDDYSIVISYNECEKYFDKSGITGGNPVSFNFRYVIIELE